MEQNRDPCRRVRRLVFRQANGWINISGSVHSINKSVYLVRRTGKPASILDVMRKKGNQNQA